MQLFDNPFYILGASMTDSLARIVELEEEASLVKDPEECARARAILSNPGQRLQAELAWFPGWDDSWVEYSLSKLEQDPKAIYNFSGNDDLALVNLAVAALPRLGQINGKPLSNYIIFILNHLNHINVEIITSRINGARQKAGIAAIRDHARVDAALNEHIINQGKALGKIMALNDLTTQRYALNGIVEFYKANKGRSASVVEILLQGYEQLVSPLLKKLESSINRSLEGITRDLANDKYPSPAVIKKVKDEILEYGKLSYPLININAANGLAYPPANAIADNIRSQAVDIYNTFDIIHIPKALTKSSIQAFGEIPGYKEQLQEDQKALENATGVNRFKILLDGLYSLMKTALKNTEENPARGLEQAEQVLNKFNSIQPQIREVADNKTYKEISDQVANLCLSLLIDYCNKTENWLSGMSFIEKIKKLNKEPQTDFRLLDTENKLSTNYSIESVLDQPTYSSSPWDKPHTSSEVGNRGCGNYLVWAAIIAVFLFLLSQCS